MPFSPALPDGKPYTITQASGISDSTGPPRKHWCADASERTSSTSGITLPLTKNIRCQGPIAQHTRKPMHVQEECVPAGRILFRSARQRKTLRSSRKANCPCRCWRLAVRRQMEKCLDSKRELLLWTPRLLYSKTPGIGCSKKIRKGRPTP